MKTCSLVCSCSAALVAASLLLGCPGGSEETVALSDQDKGIKAKPVDLDALAAARAASEGNKIEQEVVEARSLNANVKAYANKEGEPTLQDMEGSGQAPAGGSNSSWVGESANAGSAAPSDLDTMDEGEGVKPWINMQLVEQRILGKRKSFQTCWDNHGGSSGGRMDMAVTVGMNGRATSVSLAGGSPLKNGQVADCVVRALKTVKYPEPRNGAVSFVYPVKF